MIAFFTVITFFNILFERKSVTNKVKKKKEKEKMQQKNTTLSRTTSVPESSPQR